MQQQLKSTSTKQDNISGIWYSMPLPFEKSCIVNKMKIFELMSNHSAEVSERCMSLRLTRVYSSYASMISINGLDWWLCHSQRLWAKVWEYSGWLTKSIFQDEERLINAALFLIIKGNVVIIYCVCLNKSIISKTLEYIGSTLRSK